MTLHEKYKSMQWKRKSNAEHTIAHYLEYSDKRIKSEAEALEAWVARAYRYNPEALKNRAVHAMLLAWFDTFITTVYFSLVLLIHNVKLGYQVRFFYRRYFI